MAQILVIFWRGCWSTANQRDTEVEMFVKLPEKTSSQSSKWLENTSENYQIVLDVLNRRFGEKLNQTLVFWREKLCTRATLNEKKKKLQW